MSLPICTTTTTVPSPPCPRKFLLQKVSELALRLVHLLISLKLSVIRFGASPLSPIQDDLQKSTDDYIKKLDTMLKTKEKDLLTL
jgi:hypothetical protein